MKTDNFNNSGFNEPDLGSKVQGEAQATPAPSNESGQAALDNSEMQRISDDPRLVTRGESNTGVSPWYEVDSEDGDSYYIISFANPHRPIQIKISKPKVDGVANAAIVDYLNCTFPFDNRKSIHDFFYKLLPIIGSTFAPVIQRNGGLYGYLYSFKLGESSALFAYGGNADTAFLSFSGTSCHQIPDWDKLVDFLSNSLKAHITRWDGAYDDFSGINSVDLALQKYQENLFSCGGRKPQMDQRGNWIEPDGRGRTLYVGASENGKLARIYEKGMELGIPYHPWVRWEVQLGNRDRIIPWDAVLEPGKYLAGSYPKALGWISQEQCRIRTLQKTADIGYEISTHYASIAYGKLINVMMEVEGSAEKVVEILRRDGLPARLNLPILPNYGIVLP